MNYPEGDGGGMFWLATFLGAMFILYCLFAT